MDSSTPIIVGLVGFGVLVLSLCGLLQFFAHRQSKAHAARAAQLFREGASAREVLHRLVTEGLARERAVSIVQAAALGEFSRQAKIVLNEGGSPEAAEAKLREQGVGPQTAMAIVADALEATRSFPEQVGRAAGGLVLMAAGAAVVLGGFVLYAGNKSGRFPTFPFAGGVTMLLGAALAIGGGAKLSGQRVAVTLGALVVLAGIGLCVLGFVLGSATNNPVYTALLPIAGVFVACLGAGVIANFFELRQTSREAILGPNQEGKM
jgi:hypothetical protein